MRVLSSKMERINSERTSRDCIVKKTALSSTQSVSLENLEDWEIHGKMNKDELYNVVNIKGYCYKFYYSNEQYASLHHTWLGTLQVTYETMELDVYEKYQVDYVIILTFNEKLAHISPENFIEAILIKLYDSQFFQNTELIHFLPSF